MTAPRPYTAPRFDCGINPSAMLPHSTSRRGTASREPVVVRFFKKTAKAVRDRCAYLLAHESNNWHHSTCPIRPIMTTPAIAEQCRSGHAPLQDCHLPGVLAATRIAPSRQCVSLAGPVVSVRVVISIVVWGVHNRSLGAEPADVAAVGAVA